MSSLKTNSVCVIFSKAVVDRKIVFVVAQINTISSPWDFSCQLSSLITEENEQKVDPRNSPFSFLNQKIPQWFSPSVL